MADTVGGEQTLGIGGQAHMHIARQLLLAGVGCLAGYVSQGCDARLRPSGPLLSTLDSLGRTARHWSCIAGRRCSAVTTAGLLFYQVDRTGRLEWVSVAYNDTSGGAAARFTRTIAALSSTYGVPQECSGDRQSPRVRSLRWTDGQRSVGAESRGPLQTIAFLDRAKDCTALPLIPIRD